MFLAHAALDRSTICNASPSPFERPRTPLRPQMRLYHKSQAYISAVRAKPAGGPTEIEIARDRQEAGLMQVCRWK
eukprot:5753227-Pleurochrysis_carterae.AAC.1